MNLPHLCLFPATLAAVPCVAGVRAGQENQPPLKAMIAPMANEAETQEHAEFKLIQALVLSPQPWYGVFNSRGGMLSSNHSALTPALPILARRSPYG